MQFRVSRSLLTFMLSAFSVSMLTYSAILLADDMDDDQETSSQPAAAASPANTDSLYAIIQQDFGHLEPIWKKACYDCHSDKTVYPWYHKLPIVKGMLEEHITEARAELDMSNGFPFISKRNPVDDLRKLGSEVAEGEMPLTSYKLMHWSACLSQEEKDTVAAFVANSLKIMAANGITPTQRQPKPEGN